MRADLKGEVVLGAVLLATALLVGGGSLSQVHAVGRDVIASTGTLALLGIVGGLASVLASVAAAIVVDRRGPRWLMPLGALVAGVGFMLLALAGSLWWLILASVVTSLGMAGASGGVLFAVLVKGCYRIRGTVIGVLVFGTSLGRTATSPLLDALDPRATALVFAGLALVGAVLLFWALPRVFPVLRHSVTLPTWRPTPEDESELTGGGLMQLPGFWRVTGMITLVFVLSTALSGQLRGWSFREFYGDSEGIPYLLPVATAFGALFWGIASDYFRARFLITAASLMAALALGLFWLFSEQPGMVGVVVIGLTMGATRSLLWVLLADHIGVRFFATVGVAVSAPAGFLGGLSMPLLLNHGGSEGSLGVVAVLAIALAIAAFTVPRLRFHQLVTPLRGCDSTPSRS